MMSRRRALALAGSSVIAALSVPSSAVAQTAGKRAVPSRGFNLPGWLDRIDGSEPSEAAMR